MAFLPQRKVFVLKELSGSAATLCVGDVFIITFGYKNVSVHRCAAELVYLGGTIVARGGYPTMRSPTRLRQLLSYMAGKVSRDEIPGLKGLLGEDAVAELHIYLLQAAQLVWEAEASSRAND